MWKENFGTGGEPKRRARGGEENKRKDGGIRAEKLTGFSQTRRGARVRAGGAERPGPPGVCVCGGGGVGELGGGALLCSGEGVREGRVEKSEGGVLLMEGGVHLRGNPNPLIWTVSNTDSKKVSHLWVCVCVCHHSVHT